MSRLEHTDEESTLYYDSGVTHRSLSAINNRNTETEKALLLDISSNKEWMASVTRNVHNANSTYLTVRRLIAVNADNRDNKITIEDGKQATATEDVPLSFDISRLINGMDQNHCKFLSISRDGKYIALSFYYSPGAIKNRENIECFLFEVLPKSVRRLESLSFNGRAVFLNDEKDSLLLVDAESIRYSDFLNHPYKNTVFDLNIFVPGVEPILPTHHDSYIKNSSWLNLQKENDDIKKLITFTKHIRQNILIMPYDAIRIWSLSEKCILQSSINAEGQHIMAFSKSDNDAAADYKIENNTLAATYSESDQVVNVYNVKNGLIVYSLKVQRGNFGGTFRISHMYFCLDNRYLAISGMEGNTVIFEVWYLYSEKSIYNASRDMGETSDNLIQSKAFEPFIIQNRNNDNLTGFYMSKNGDQLETNFLDLHIVPGIVSIACLNDDITQLCDEYNEIDDNLMNFQNLKCFYVYMEGENCIIRFGKHTIQFWKVSSEGKSDGSIHQNDELRYIRAYKGPDYGLKYSFRETWRIRDYNSIEFTEGNVTSRLLVYITPDKLYNCKDHREEIFLVSNEANSRGIFDSHKFESACQALHYLYNAKGYKNKENMAQLRSKTQELIISSLNGIGPKSTYFTNIAGNRTLAMLASFGEGRKIIAKIMAKPFLISIYSYPKLSPETKMTKPKEVDEAIRNWRGRWKKLIGKQDNETSSQEDTSETSLVNSNCEPNPTNNTAIAARNENVLTVLVENSSYKLFKLLFNRVLSDSKTLGTGSLSVLTDVALFLQEIDSELLLPSIKKLSYIRISEDKGGLLAPELKAYKSSYGFHHKNVADIANLEPYAITEELQSYTYVGWILLRPSIEAFRDAKRIINYFTLTKLREISKEESTKTLKVCVISFQYFSLHNGYKGSPFIRTVLNRRGNSIFKQKDTVFEISLEYKWKEFVRTRFILICFIHALYYISYSTGVLFSRSLYVKGTENEFDMKHPEIRQFIKTPNMMHYILSGYNWVDFAAFAFPAYTVLQSLLGLEHFGEVCSVTNLILWTHGVLRLRVISHFGFALEIIIQLFKRVFVTLCIMFLAIVAFTISFIILLSSKSDKFFQDNSSGNFTSTTSSTEGTVDILNVSSSNGFASLFKAFSNVWLFIYGVWDPVTQGDAGDSKMIMAMCIFFTFTIVLVFFNVIIALMASAVEEVRKRGRKAWVDHFAFVVSEIELLWCFEYENKSRRNNPLFIYYVAKEETIRKHEKELEKETEELKNEIKKLENETKELENETKELETKELEKETNGLCIKFPE
ncbi:hypothetical protein INT48_000910 [Thamnidium elegans]|uniref:Ion transport domain-containing protein n=1 Tax=Thamnidium elegans TaxID=101142 RepID=A0A8H7VUL0_9FUNG|nr:hypothetical protein INT48_000910 [Thamnidium elegans]